MASVMVEIGGVALRNNVVGAPSSPEALEKVFPLFSFRFRERVSHSCPRRPQNTLLLVDALDYGIKEPKTHTNPDK
jgi:hypothetical protein